MKRLLFILFTLIYISSYSQAKLGSGGGLIPTGGYAGYYAIYMQGGLKSGWDTIARNNVPSYLRDTTNFLFLCTSDNSFWVLKGGILNSNYVKLTLGSQAVDVSTKMNYTDTAAMLANYQSAILANNTNIAALLLDTATIQPRLNNIIASLPNITGKVNISDTAAMLANYQSAMLANNTNITALISDTATIQPRLNNILASMPNITGKVNISDTAAMLANYQSAILANKTNITALITDTATIQPRLNNILASMPNITGKVNISDTAAMLANYQSAILANTTNITALVADTATIQPRFNNIIASIPNITGKVNISDTAAMLANYRTGIDLKANLASPAFTGTPTAPTPVSTDVSNSLATTAFVATAVGAATIPDASVSAKGKIQLAGDLTGTADLPVIADGKVTTSKIADANISTAKILDANVTTSKLADASVTYAKIQNIAPARLLGNPTGTAGASHEIALGTGLRFSGDSLYSSGGGTGSVDTFTSNITVTSTNGLGKYSTGSVITAIGKTASQVLIDALSQTIPPTYVKPSAIMTTAGGTVEIGSSILPVNLTSTFTANDGGAATGTVYSRGGVSLGAGVVSDNINSITSPVSYTVTVTYGPGTTCKPNNLGVLDCTGQITAGSVTSTAITFTPSAKRYWGRCSGVPNSAAIITAAGGGNELIASKTKTGFSVTASGSNNIYFAYPASLGALTAISVGGFDSFSAFTQNTVSFTNASNYTQSYYVYVSNNTFSGDATNINVQ